MHPDHVYGLPALVQNLIILGRRAPLPVYCRTEHVRGIRRLLGLFDLTGPRRALVVQVAGIEPREQVDVLRTADLALTASPNVHGPMPNLAVRVDAGDGSLVYSSDTRPCREVARLARDAAVLVHEATFARPDRGQWHSTGRQAGQVARAARVRRLFLAHIGYALHGAIPRLVADARSAFGGPVRAVRELTWYRV
jgi:ribonuclease Z